MLKETFSLGGYRVETAESGEEALKYSKKNVYVMFLDLRCRMSGIDLLENSGTGSGKYIYAITGYSSYYGL